MNLNQIESFKKERVNSEVGCPKRGFLRVTFFPENL